MRLQCLEPIKMSTVGVVSDDKVIENEVESL